MAVSPVETLMKLESLAKPVLELILSAVEAVSAAKTEKEAARRLGTFAARKILLG